MNPTASRRRFAQRSLDRAKAEIEVLRRRLPGVEVLAAVIEADREGWERRRSACVGMSALKRGGWRVDSSGQWIAPGSSQRTDFEFAVKMLAGPRAQPAPASATKE
jgi:hypothetical protein